VNYLAMRSILQGARMVPGTPPRPLALDGALLVWVAEGSQYRQISERMVRDVWQQRQSGTSGPGSSTLFVVHPKLKSAVMGWIGTIRRLLPAKALNGCRFGQEPSKGFLALFAALQFCGWVDMYGFQDGPEDRYHYWEPAGSQAFFPGAHNVATEHALLDVLARAVAIGATPIIIR
jgi:hypothetical protein